MSCVQGIEVRIGIARGAELRGSRPRSVEWFRGSQPDSFVPAAVTYGRAPTFATLEPYRLLMQSVWGTGQDINRSHQSAFVHHDVITAGLRKKHSLSQRQLRAG